MRLLAALFALLGPFPSLAAPQAGGGGASDDATRPSAANTQLRQAVVNAAQTLALTEAWQKQIVQEDVITQYAKFIREARQAEGGVSNVLVDQDSLRRFLVFYPPKLYKQGNPKVLLLVRPEPGCQKCTDAAPEIQRKIKSKLERRGLIPLTVSLEDVGDHRATGKALEDRVAVLAKSKGAVGSVVLQWQVAPPDDLDTAHADETKYWVMASLNFPDTGRQGGKLEILDSDSIEVAVWSLVTDSMIALGSKVELAQAGDQEPGREEVWIRLNGIRDFAQFTRARGQIMARVKDMGTLEDRAFARGQVTLALLTKRTVDEIRRLLGALGSDPGWDKTLSVEVVSGSSA